MSESKERASKEKEQGESTRRESKEREKRWQVNQPGKVKNSQQINLGLILCMSIELKMYSYYTTFHIIKG